MAAPPARLRPPSSRNRPPRHPGRSVLPWAHLPGRTSVPPPPWRGTVALAPLRATGGGGGGGAGGGSGAGGSGGDTRAELAAVGRWGEALVYNLLLATLPPSRRVDWLNQEAETRAPCGSLCVVPIGGLERAQPLGLLL